MYGQLPKGFHLNVLRFELKYVVKTTPTESKLHFKRLAMLALQQSKN